MSKARITSAVVAALAMVGAIVFGAVSAGGAARTPRPTRAATSTAAPVVDGTLAKFTFLAQQRSNRCNLAPAELMQMSNDSRLQGSCCFPMNQAAYRSQVNGLREYAAISQIPRDPYDVPVSLAKRLLAYERTIQLSHGQARTYAHAMRMASTKGPCCCHCWRWDAFRGLSNYLIADRRYTAVQLAHVIDLVEGCGGPTGS